VETKVLEEDGSKLEIKISKDNHSKMETEKVPKESRSKVKTETKETQSAQRHCRDFTTETYHLESTVERD
jgi:hypothetical protein